MKTTKDRYFNLLAAFIATAVSLAGIAILAATTIRIINWIIP